LKSKNKNTSNFVSFYEVSFVCDSCDISQGRDEENFIITLRYHSYTPLHEDGYYYRVIWFCRCRMKKLWANTTMYTKKETSKNFFFCTRGILSQKHD